MAMSDSAKRTLIDILDDQFERLSEEAYGAFTPSDDADAPPRIGFVDKLRLFEAGQKWAATETR